MMTPEQTQLLNKLQLIGHPAVADVSPLTMSQEEACDFFKQNLPILEYQTAVAIKPNRETEEKVFWGMNEYDCKKQIDRWIDENGYTLDHRPNPYFGSGEDWLKYFKQPISQVNLKSLEKHFDEWEIKIPKETREIPDGDKVRKETFSRLELGFDDVDPAKLEFAVEKQKAREYAELHRITPEQRVEIKALQAAGKAPAIDRSEYLKMDRHAAEEYLSKYRDTPENTFESVSYEKKKTPAKTEAFPEYRPANLIGKQPADYLQRSILRDLAEEGHIATPETKKEFLDKIQYITKEQAAKLIEGREDLPAGARLIEQCRAYCRFGQIYNSRDVNTIADVQKLYQTNRSYDFDKKAALRDLVDDGFITSPDAQAKIEFLTEKQEDLLLDRYGDELAGPRVRAKIMDLVSDGAIGGLEDEHFQSLSVRDAMHIISQNSEISRSKNERPASGKQKELLQKMEQRGQIDLSKVNMETLSARKAHELIDANIRNQFGNLNGPATEKQRQMIRALVRAGAASTIPASEWKSLTKQQASAIISAVPEEKRKEIMANRAAERTAPPASRKAPERGIE
ncbi:MAG: hypothetical protein E7055_21680 [Lentisphaerae bacterium]|nr:hypothetical protein [Lentisphaerota bacterium]